MKNSALKLLYLVVSMCSTCMMLSNIDVRAGQGSITLHPVRPQAQILPQTDNCQYGIAATVKSSSSFACLPDCPVGNLAATNSCI